MRRGGVRELTVPPALAFGATGKLVAEGVTVPLGATLTYIVRRTCRPPTSESL